MIIANTQKKLFLSLLTILLGVPIIQPVFANADTNNPHVSFAPQDAHSETITINFPNTIDQGNIIDIEVYDSSNQKVWQAYTDKGGNNFSAVTSSLPDGTYTVKGGVFTANWQSTTAWFSNLATFTLPTNPTTDTLSPTPISTDVPTITSVPSSDSTQSAVATAAVTAYQDWKNRFLVTADDGTLRVMRPENSNDTVSEGIGYGMLLSLFAKDQTTFDGLWKYATKHLDDKGMMNWDISSTNTVIGSGSATDADEDMAYALTKASLLWPGKSYDAQAKQLIGAIKKNEVMTNNLMNPGDNWGSTQVVDPSYLAPSYYRAFAQITGDIQWNDVAQTNSNWLAKAANNSTGLVPDWINADFSPASNDFDQHQHDFWYDAIRTPIRMLMTYKADRDNNAQTILQKEAAFYNSIGVDKLLSGYTIAGSPITNYIDTTFLSGYTAAGEVDPSTSYSQTMVKKLIDQKPDGYFGSSLRALTLFVIAN